MRSSALFTSPGLPSCPGASAAAVARRTSSVMVFTLTRMASIFGWLSRVMTWMLASESFTA